MSPTTIKKYAVVAGLSVFTLVFFGSWFYGARFFSSLIRGVEGFALFGLLTWLMLRGWAAMNSEERPGGGKDKGVNLDQTA